jgi:hypothetical protein
MKIVIRNLASEYIWHIHNLHNKFPVSVLFIWQPKLSLSEDAKLISKGAKQSVFYLKLLGEFKNIGWTLAERKNFVSTFFSYPIPHTNY